MLTKIMTAKSLILRSVAFAAIVVLGAGQTASAAQVTFATWATDQNIVHPTDFIFNNNGNNGPVGNGGTFATPHAIPVLFTYSAGVITGNLPPALQGPQNATVVITSGGQTTQPGTDNGFTTAQPINSFTTYSFNLVTPYFGKSNLLTLTFGLGSNNNPADTPQLNGSSGGTTAGLNGDNKIANSAVNTRQFVSFSSDFLVWSSGSRESFSSSYTGINPDFQLVNNTTNPFLLSFTNAVGSGSFASDPNPSFTPEPSSIIMASLGVLGMAGYGWNRRRRNAITV